MFRPLAVTALLLSATLLRASPESEGAHSALQKWQAETPARAERLVHIVYFTPADCEPAPRYQERLGKIMEDIRAFYRREMERNGFGAETFGLAHTTDGRMRVTVVKGHEPAAKYLRESGHAIREECVPVLREAGIEADRETIVIFCNLSEWDPEHRKISQHSPYYASGTNRSGTAWQVDSPLLNLDALPERGEFVQDGEYGRISLGRYNSIFIGGIAHELGHALGLPHDCERPEERPTTGTALMGSGNRTYGREKREEGRGSFLTLSEALRLASHPAFCGSVKGIETKSDAHLTDLALQSAGPAFTLTGRVSAEPPPYAVIGYMDPAGTPPPAWLCPMRRDTFPSGAMRSVANPACCESWSHRRMER